MESNIDFVKKFLKELEGRNTEATLSYFSENAIELIHTVKRLKRQGMTMAEIVRQLSTGKEPDTDIREQQIQRPAIIRTGRTRRRVMRAVSIYTHQW